MNYLGEQSYCGASTADPYCKCDSCAGQLNSSLEFFYELFKVVQEEETL